MDKQMQEDTNRNSMKRFWTFIKHKKLDGNTIPPLKSNGVLHSQSEEKANILNNQFQKAFSEKTEITNQEFKTRCEMQGNFPTMPDIFFTENGITKLLANLNPHKAAGLDNIMPRVLKELAIEISPILTLIFSKSYQSGEVPSIWRTAHVCPIYKKGKKSEAINYRPVSLTCIACKLMEHVVTSNIMAHVDRNNILNPLQHGFRTLGLSCDTQMVEFVDNITKNLDSGKQIDCLIFIMDFSKAFDKVSHCLLVHKLDHYGIRGKTNTWIQNFLKDRKQSVVVEGVTSEYISVQSGVPQGSVLGSSLFLYYINDMPDNIRSTVRLFADDTIMYLTITSDVDAVHLQEDLDKLASWEQAWMMSFHPEKCNVLTV